jgi:antitoxin HicB
MKNVLAYPAVFDKEEKGFNVSFPDFPRAHTCGADEKEAYRMAVDCLRAAIEYALEDKQAIPKPSPVRKSQHAIPVTLDLAPKVALFQLMTDRGISNLKLANQMGIRENAVRRMLDPSHQSKPDQYIRALAALDAAVQVSVVEL